MNNKMKNNMIYNIQKRSFSKNSPSNMDRPDIDRLNRKLVSLREKQETLRQERNDLNLDKEVANVHRLTLVKKENNQMVTEEEENAISDIKETYSEFFEEEVEESDPEVETSAEYKERKQVAEVVQYLKEELKSNADEMEKVARKWHAVHRSIIQRLNNTESIPESSASVNRANSQTSESEGSNTQTNPEINQSTSDYIDNLSQQHNPFDDIGGD